MPITNPKSAARQAPQIMAITRRMTGMVTVLARMPDTQMPQKAPTLMNPACPRLSSPDTPTFRFRPIDATT